MHRLRDAKVVSGWIQNMFGHKVEVLTNAETPIQIGDRFRFELHGRKTSAVFEASLSNVEQFDLTNGGAMYGIDGTSARVIEAEWVSLRFTVVTQFRFANALQPFRTKVKDLQATLTHEGACIIGDVIDVAQSGYSVSVPEALIPGSRIVFRMETNVGTVNGNGIVRNCRRAKNGQFRAGVQLLEMGRLDRPRWDRFIDELY